MIPVVVTRVGSWPSGSPVLECDGIRCKHHEPGSGQRWSERLVLVAHQAEDLRLAEVALTCVLVQDNDTGEWADARWLGEEGRDGVIFGDEVDEVADVPVVMPGRSVLTFGVCVGSWVPRKDLMCPEDLSIVELRCHITHGGSGAARPFDV